jgi:hypothetical protein
MKLIVSSLWVLLATPALAAPPAVKLTLAPSADGVIATYELAAPVTSFRFEEGAPAAVRAAWRFESAFLAGDGKSVEAADAASFQRFSIVIPNDAARRDRVYPALSKAGKEGWVVYLPYLRPATAQYTTSVAVTLPAGHTTIATDGTAIVKPDARYVFLGPASYVSGDKLKVVADPGAPAWLTAQARVDFETAVATYGKRLGATLRARPIVIVDLISAGGAEDFGWRGDTTDNIVFLRFIGAKWLEPDATRVLTARRFAYHEAFHLWNGWRFHALKPAEYPWLDEGAAEYASWRALRDLGLETPAAFNDAIGGALSRCRAVLEDQPLAGFAGRNGSTPYDCGTTLHWIAELGAARTGKEPKDFFALWRKIFQNAGKQNGEYSLDDWLSPVTDATQPADSAALIRSLLDQSGLTRWARMPERLRLLGVNLGTFPADATEVRRRFVMHLLAQSCEGHYGYYKKEASLKLDTGNRCGKLPVDPEIDTAEELNFFTNDPLSAYELVAGRCARGEDVTLSNSATRASIKLPCRKPLPKLPEQYRVR